MEVNSLRSWKLKRTIPFSLVGVVLMLVAVCFGSSADVQAKGKKRRACIEFSKKELEKALKREREGWQLVWHDEFDGKSLSDAWTRIPRFKNLKLAYVVSLLAGAAGFASVMFIHNQYLLFVSYFLIGFAWAAMLALPFTFLTNALEGNPYMGSYLGLFNCTICLPQIVAAATGGAVISLAGGSQGAMLLLAGVFLVLGACSVALVKTKQTK